MTSGRQLSEAVEHKLPQSPREEVNPQLINAYTRNESSAWIQPEMEVSSCLIFYPNVLN